MTVQNYRTQWFSNLGDARRDVLAGIVVALALIPEAIGFSIISGVDPRVGLYASVAIAIVISFLGGRPAMISAATAAVAVVVTPLVREHGVDYLFAATILMGLIQIAAGFLRLDLVMQFVSRSVITGFVNALAILIFMAQLPQLTGVTWHSYALVAGGLAIIYLLPRVTKAVPSPLVAILVLAGISIAMGLPVRTVGDMGRLPEGLPSLVLPHVPLTFETLRIILPYSLTMAAVGLLESLLTAQIVDDMTDTDSDKRRECVGQGGANIAAALVGGMGGCAMIGQSVINVTSGGRKRLSTLTAGLFLLFLLAVLGPVVGRIPMPALVAVMIMVSIGTFSWNSIPNLRRHPPTSSIVMLVTVAVVVATRDLAQGVLAGVLLSGVFFAGKVRRLFAVERIEEAGAIRYRVTGQIFFASVDRFTRAFLPEQGRSVVIDVSAAHFWDISGVGALDKIVARLRRDGSAVEVIGYNQASADLVDRFALHDKTGFELGAVPH
ncbi:permease family protein [Sphingomonas sp. S17]|uniref:SulP family inorganic anion transporter n=3 Tax=Pseudomonadota TaxID=1224 RepID=A0A411LL62_SPHPI|nr:MULTISPECIES: SulP family inorganic anion transporter [Sphingomonas]EGI54763.1 permease family protein [Sphingomonas sp. S17]MCM3680073.1 SulP family inorganic anion transporter [Sphingomonas paucimobilis]MDG5970263.1 SulP family inorganic anion transporter [Sphingomonas paucimobilis]NNG56222.1 SulP family inorganic anion transporter [Sphingomonas paucimobilis]QBE93071.1 SulP family inorganic anion transporter [Sphingomonas paucimobilis]